MKCASCYTDSTEWLNKFLSRPRVYLDKLYFEENKVQYREDDRGMYISGQTFFEIESKKAEKRCPKCGCPIQLNADSDTLEVQWGPI